LIKLNRFTQIALLGIIAAQNAGGSEGRWRKKANASTRGAQLLPLRAAIGSRVSAASSVCAISAVAREIGAENANSNVKYMHFNRKDAEERSEGHGV